MTTMFWVLIIFGANGHGSVATAEFYTEKLCLDAKRQVEAYSSPTNNRYGAICVKRIEKA